MSVEFICPYCMQVLKANMSPSASCTGCGRLYSQDEGVVRFLDQKHDFYEGAYENQVRFVPRSERIWHTWPLWLINSSYPWAVRRYVPPGSTVIELGCAGGVRYFGSRYHMIGCDLSLSSLKMLNTVYELRIQADASKCIPLPDNSVDAVVSSYFWEHIPPEVKPRILAECRRILRPNGKIVFLYDVETRNPLIRRFKKKDRSLYDHLFIEGDGHLGYQSPQTNLALFSSAGFNIISQAGMEKTWIVSSSALTKLAEFEAYPRWLNVLTRAFGRKPLFYPYTALIRLIDALVCRWLPEDWARVDLVVCRKG